MNRLTMVVPDPHAERPAVERLAVVVPAHDEQELVTGCLEALAVAAAAVALPVEVIVVADACTDGTASIAAAAGATVLVVDARNVGHARAAGMSHALRRGPDGLWLVTTDADSRVAPEWLAWQVRHADAGAGLVAGTVEVDDWTPWPPALPGRYAIRYRESVRDFTHAHVHGANLGFSAHTYLAAGGFPALARDEDRALIAAARAAGARIVTDTRCPVLTSARPDGRAPHGFAAHLTTLAG